MCTGTDLASVLTSPSAWICKDEQDVSEKCIQNKEISPFENLVLRKIFLNGFILT